MNKFSKSRAGLFLIELILAILFFSLGSAICVQAFAKARLMSDEAEDLSFASSQVSGAAAVMRYCDGSSSGAAAWFPNAEEKNGTLYVYYDSNRQPCKAENSSYTMEIVSSETKACLTSHISMSGEGGDVLYELDIRYPAAAETAETAGTGEEAAQ